MSACCLHCGNDRCVCALRRDLADYKKIVASGLMSRRRDKHSRDLIRSLRRRVRNLKEQVDLRDISIGRWRTEARYWKSEAQRLMRARRQENASQYAASRGLCDEIRRLRSECNALKQTQWEPADGIWLVHRNPSGGRSSTLVARVDAAEREAILRAVLQVDADVATRAILDAYDRSRFCPTMLAHEDHDGSCGVWPSANSMWEAVRDALAKDIAKGGDRCSLKISP